MADVLKMANAKVDPSVIQAYVRNSAVAYNLSAGEIIALRDHGVSSDVLTAMIQRGGELRAQAMSAGQMVAAPPVQTSYPAPATAYAPAPAYSYSAQPDYSAYGYAYPVYSYSYPAYSYSYPGYSCGYLGCGYGYPGYCGYGGYCGFGYPAYCGYGGYCGFGYPGYCGYGYRGMAVTAIPVIGVGAAMVIMATAAFTATGVAFMATAGASLVLRAARGAFAPLVALAGRSPSVVTPVPLVRAQSPSVAVRAGSAVALEGSVDTLAVSAAALADSAVMAGGARRSTYGSRCHQ